MLLVTLLLPDFVEGAQLRALFALQFLNGFVELRSVSAFQQSDALQDLSQEDLTRDVNLVSELLLSSLTDLN